AALDADPDVIVGRADGSTDAGEGDGAGETRNDAPDADETPESGSGEAKSESGEVGSPSAEAEPETSVKEEQVGTYMYLPKRQKKDVERRYTVLKADFEYEFDRDFEKNRHFFPLLVEHGLRRLEEASATDVREMLRALDR
ncbi:hypothetical protein ACFQE1_22085, partial [Halobium palmae]